MCSFHNCGSGLGQHVATAYVGQQKTRRPVRWSRVEAGAYFVQGAQIVTLVCLEYEAARNSPQQILVPVGQL